MNHLPSLFISHGAPTFALDPGAAGPALTLLGAALPRPQAVLVVSAHWTTAQPHVSTVQTPRTIHDFGGFPPPLYALQYPAPGHPALAQRTVQLLQSAGWDARPDATWGLDHGAWVPLRYLYPEADVPVFQVSMPANLDAEGAHRYGQALAPLADEGVLIVGSGSLTHNLSEFRMGAEQPATYVTEFVHWVRDAAQRGDRASLVQTLQLAPHALRAHPSDDHFLPMLVALGAAPQMLPLTIVETEVRYGMLSMESYVFGWQATGAL